MIRVSICLSDIPKELISTADNGKQYLNMVVDKLREPDKFKNTHTVYASQSKEERESKKPKIYIGKGKELIFNNQPQTPSPTPVISQAEDEDDLPF